MEASISVKPAAAFLRTELEKIGQTVKELMKNDNHEEGHDIGEVKANIMLAYRHIEDARMRLGKVIQAEDGGKSIYNQ